MWIQKLIIYAWLLQGKYVLFFFYQDAIRFNLYFQNFLVVFQNIAYGRLFSSLFENVLVIPTELKPKNWLNVHIKVVGSKGLNKFVNCYSLQRFTAWICCRISGHSLRQVLFVYRLIVATLIGNIFHDPFWNWNQNFG